MKVSIGNFPKNGDRKIKVEISDHDCWNLDSTLAYVIAPALKKYKETKSGAPSVDDEDVPNELKSTSCKKKNEWNTDSNWFKRWDYVLDEMIFAFETMIEIDWLYRTKEVEERVKNGLRLFGKYYQGLWD